MRDGHELTYSRYLYLVLKTVFNNSYKLINNLHILHSDLDASQHFLNANSFFDIQVPTLFKYLQFLTNFMAKGIILTPNT